MSPRRALICLTLLTVLATGCNRPFFKEAPNPVEIDAREYDRIYQAAIDVLRDYGFRVDRRDDRFGRITTQPLNSPTVLEPWRGDNTTGRQAWQSTLTDLRRTVTVFIDPKSDDPDPQAYDLRIEVLLENRQLPTRRLIPAQGRNMFSMLSAVPHAWQQRGIDRRYWEPIGRDPYLEDRLIRAIVEHSMSF